ncbi:amidohydrolase family protein [Nakamurella endophytica]|uniref:Amidohydrolase n=1 Tax=Nakamurella endophytica TaxID=1748367 RepID=A0A917SU40_9ACTN|nr:amidohydrolase family protein [Nakamurella endophytica]GGL99120.1 amidohydrolase [Nakamurella endophytica]
MSSTDDVALVDHHCHGLLRTDPSPDEFRVLATESDRLTPDGTETLDSPFGLGIQRFCAPLLDLPRHAGVESYLDRRAELGRETVDRRLMAATGTGRLLIDSGSLMSPLLSPREMEDGLGIPADEIVRLEHVAETVARTATAASFADDVRAALQEADAAGAVGWKSIIAYRYGLDIRPDPPTATQVTEAAGRWLAGCEASGRYRLEDPVLLHFLIWAAIPFGKPIQFHAGYGDSDIELFRADPSRATRFFAATVDSGASFTLLHCYPFVREAAVLSQVFPHVYCDVGSVTHFLGPSAGTVVRQVMEIAPFSKVLYSSDAHAISEEYLVSALAWRRETGRLLDEWIADDWLTADHAERIAADIGAGNAVRLYRLQAASTGSR